MRIQVETLGAYDAVMCGPKRSHLPMNCLEQQGERKNLERKVAPKCDLETGRSRGTVTAQNSNDRENHSARDLKRRVSIQATPEFRKPRFPHPEKGDNRGDPVRGFEAFAGS
jgi:hypothetical protein